VLYHARISPDLREAEYTYDELDSRTGSRRLLQAHALVLADYEGTFMVYELDADGVAFDDTWFETLNEAFEVYDDVEWREVQ
jgi:hypothetical protein